MVTLLLACVSEAPDTLATGDDTAAEVDPLAYLEGTAALATVSDGTCPTIDGGGDVTFTSGGLERTVKVLFPDGGGVGKPVLFAWYPLGGSVNYLVNALALRDYADLHDTIVVVPEASGEDLFEWAFAAAVADNHDLVLFDDMRTCLYEQYTIDLGRVTAMGFSAGALWTSYLAIHRGDTLATILPFSGGADPVVAYDTPAGPFPALLPYGGSSDLYGGGVVDFAETTANFADSLVEDGHFVVTCNHEGGHTIPPEGRDMMDAWLPAHAYGEQSSFVAGLSALPDYCSVHE